jgi:hypothetical protein
MGSGNRDDARAEGHGGWVSAVVSLLAANLAGSWAVPDWAAFLVSCYR